MFRNITRLLIIVAVLAGLSTGCQTITEKKAPMMKTWKDGNVLGAARGFGDFADKQCGTNDLIDWHQEAGAACRASGDFTNSNRHFDMVADRFDKYEHDPKYSVTSEFGALLTNPQNLPYKGRSYDKIMTYTYRALNYLAMGEVEKARPEIIHAYQCQQDAVDENKRRIEKAKEAYDKRNDRQAIESAKNNPKCVSQQESVAKDLEGFKFYADYVNPFTVYLDGLYFLYAGVGGSDLEHARKTLNRVKETAGENKFILADLKLAEDGGNEPPTPFTYIIFETGHVASLKQIRFFVPFVVGNEAIVIPVAYPKLDIHNDQAPQLTVKAGEVTEQTLLVANMDAIVALDFKNEWPVILTKAMISTAMKAAAQAFTPSYGRIILAGTQLATTIADTRSWETLPKEFQLARISTPADRKLVLSTPGATPVEVTVADGIVNVVYVKSFAASSPLLVNQFKLK